MGRPKKNLVLDTSAIVNFWLKPEAESPIAQLIQTAETSVAQLWIAGAIIPTLEYVTVRRLKEIGMPAKQARQVVKQLMESLFKRVGILSCFGFEQADIYATARDFEDAQIAAAARILAGQQVCIVTEDDSFDSLGELPCKSPYDAVNWLADTSAEASGSESIPFIDLKTQQALLRPQLERNIETVMRHGQYIMGPEITELEEKLAKYTQTEQCIAVSSGTDALLIAMMALEIGAGDEVITTPFTFIATGEMIALLGAKAVFVDIDPKTYNLDANKIEQAITLKTKAIMPVSLYGQCADYDAINDIAAKYHLPVIEDGCQSFGATYKNKPSCGLTTIGCTSFFPSKPLGGYGDSGACFTNDINLAKAMREIRVHGQDRRYHHPRIGINGRMDTLQAAVLLAKLSVFPQEVATRAEIGANYTSLINKLKTDDSIIPPYMEAHNTSVYAQYTIQTENRAALQEKLTKAGIPTAVHYPVPLHKQPALKTSEFDLPISEELSEKVMSLPMHPYLNKKEQIYIVEMLLIS